MAEPDGAEQAPPLEAGTATAPGGEQAPPLEAGTATAPDGAEQAPPLEAGTATAPPGTPPDRPPVPAHDTADTGSAHLQAEPAEHGTVGAGPESPSPSAPVSPAADPAQVARGDGSQHPSPRPGPIPAHPPLPGSRHAGPGVAPQAAPAAEGPGDRPQAPVPHAPPLDGPSAQPGGTGHPAAPGAALVPGAASPADETPAPRPASAFGRVAPDGTVYVSTAAGERAVGSWQAGDPAEGLAFFGRKYEALAAEVELLGQRLEAGTGDPNATAAALDKLAETLPDVAAVGDLDALQARVAELRALSATKADERKARRVQREAANLARKSRLVEEAEQLAASEDWKAAGERLREILEDWKTVRVERGADADLWKRYRAARDAFTRRRGAHFAQLDEQRKQAVAAKEALVREAQGLSGSTEWGPTAQRFKDLMARWKAAPRGAREAEDRLWAAFKAAQDAFFSARSAAFSARDAELKGNADTKEAVIAEAEALPLDNPAAAQSRLRGLQERYDKAGRVPRELMHALDERMRRAEQRVRDAVERNRDARRSAEPPTMVVRLEESIAKLERRLERARAADDEATVSATEDALRTQRSWLSQAQR